MANHYGPERHHRHEGSATISATRRRVLSGIAGAAGSSLLSGFPLTGPALASANRRLFFGARGVRVDGKMNLRASGVDDTGRLVFDIPIPARAHGVAIHPRQAAIAVFARRPGTFARVIDYARGTLVASFETPPNRHFYGHGAFSPDGKLLYATENDFENKRGVIGVYDALDGYRRRGELPLSGIGPHEARLADDGTTLVIGLGGILTHPDHPRIKLNLQTMEPSLIYLDRRDGTRIDKVELPKSLYQLSIRHLALSRNGKVAFGMQYQGASTDTVPLVGVHEPGRPLRLFAESARISPTMKNYCGSIEFDATGSVIATTSPRGGLAAFWETESGRLLSSIEIEGVCGLAPASGRGKFVATSLRGGAKGGMYEVDAVSGLGRKITNRAIDATLWDNHMATILG